MNIGSTTIKKPMAGIDQLTATIKYGAQAKIRTFIGTKLMVIGGKILGAKDVRITTE